MPALVTPERTVQRINDKNALDEYAQARAAAGCLVDRNLKANLAQLLAIDKVGGDRSHLRPTTDAHWATCSLTADAAVTMMPLPTPLHFPPLPSPPLVCCCSA